MKENGRGQFEDPYVNRRFRHRLVAIVGALALVWIAWLLLKEATQVLFLIFGAILFAISFRALARRISDHTGISYKIAFGLCLLGVVGLGVGFGFWLGPRLVTQFEQLSQAIPPAIEEARTWLLSTPVGRPIVDALPDDASSFASAEMGRVMGVLSGLLDAITNVAVLLFVGVYVGLEPRLYRRGAIRAVPEPWRARADQIFDRLGSSLAWWVVGRLASMAVVGVLSAVALWALGVPLAFALGVLAALFSFVPFLGPIASVVPAALVAVAQGPNTVLYVLLAYLGVQIAESYVITPLIQKRVTSVPPALLILAQVVFGLAAGLVGVIYATPLVVLTLVVCDELLPPLHEGEGDLEGEDDEARDDDDEAREERGEAAPATS